MSGLDKCFYLCMLTGGAKLTGDDTIGGHGGGTCKLPRMDLIPSEG